MLDELIRDALREAAEKQDVPQELDRLVFERINNQGREPETGER